MTQTCALLICDQDKIPFDGEQVIYHAIDELPMHAIQVNDASALGKQLYVISRNDFEQSGDNAQRLLETIAFVPYRQIIAAISREQANQLAKGMQVLRWRDEHQFCSRCGSKTQVNTANEYAMNCPACGYHQYPRIQPCTINAIIRHIDNRPHLLLAHHQRARESGMYTLLAGFVEVGESLAQCLHREVAEEVGVQVTNLRYFDSQPWPFPTNLMVGFVVDYVSGDIRVDEEELIHADFFAIDALDQVKTPPKGTIAYDLIEFVKQEYA